MTDDWRIIPGYRERYKINSDGIVWDTALDREVAQYLSKKKQCYVVNLQRDGALFRRYVARLALQAFTPVPADNRFQPEWVDGDRTNNALSNLRWAHRSAQTRRLTEDDIRDIRRRGRSKERIKDIARSYSVSSPTICHIIGGKSWTWVKD